MFKKLGYKRLNYGDLDRIDSHDIKRDEMHSLFLTFDFLDLIRKWPEIVGEKLAAVTSPLKIKQDSLFVITKHSSYSQELSFSSEMIKKEVFKQFPNLKPIVKKLAFQTQENFFEQKLIKEKELALAPKLHPQSPKYKILKQEAEGLFSDVVDSELRDSLISLFIQSK
jgi:hypothetical protein